mmetsp:Transcript_34047/g.42013  ORF Transcript_34047/g.42013 Transcript_34047/m.42013 type:complete len:274 (+) Transcript_34047:590-1411(+)
MILMWFLVGALSSIRVNIGYVYLMELMPAKAQTLVTTIWNIQEASIYVFATLYFWKISTHWFYFVIIGFFFNLISLVLLFFLPESPRYLISVGKLEEARKGFAKIAALNRKFLDWEEQRFIKSQKSSFKKNDEEDAKTVSAEEGFEKSAVPPASYYLKQPKIMVNLVIMSLVWLATSFGYYLILSLINTFDNVYITAFTSSFSEMVAYMVAGLFYLKVGVKLSLILSFAVSTLGGLLILVWGLQDQDSTLFFIFFLFAKFGVTCTFNINFTAN